MYRHCNRKIVSRCAAEKALRKEKQRIDMQTEVTETKECECMVLEEEHMNNHLAFLDSVEFVQEVVEDLIDSSWHIIRKLHLSRRKLNKKAIASQSDQERLRNTKPAVSAAANIPAHPEYDSIFFLLFIGYAV